MDAYHSRVQSCERTTVVHQWCPRWFDSKCNDLYGEWSAEFLNHWKRARWWTVLQSGDSDDSLSRDDRWISAVQSRSFCCWCLSSRLAMIRWKWLLLIQHWLFLIPIRDVWSERTRKKMRVEPSSVCLYRLFFWISLSCEWCEEKWKNTSRKEKWRRISMRRENRSWSVVEPSPMFAWIGMQLCATVPPLFWVVVVVRVKMAMHVLCHRSFGKDRKSWLLMKQMRK